MSEEKFLLNGDPRNNYVNLILNDMRTFNFRKQNREFTKTIGALAVLLLDLPPAGQDFLKQEIESMYGFEKNMRTIGSYEEANRIYQKIMSWVWPNMLQEYFNAKPRNPQPTTLGE